ncbi:autophagy evasion T3SS effector BopA [Burkholderia ubonensis]|uniref:autophagy evasion T3SS effector BopA n=1 Tax=Burkholderia ubonensis TaxID=101571 RepID=UPI00075FDC0F|nr:autophagy evasion T3SS effector BopA [Burkholderia ubonensis]KWN86119.1 multidrug DMT transporter permease [Burkholderia ubonensis]
MINVDAFVESAQSGARVVVGGDTRGPAVSVARLGVKERLFAFFAHVPLLKDCGAVRRYAEQVRTENRRALEVFVLALSQRFGPEGAKAAFDYGARRDGVPLDRRLVRNMVSIAEHFRGTGDAKSLVRQIVFRTWECLGVRHPGHASLTIKNQANAAVDQEVYEHISWWPNQPLTDKESFDRVEPKMLSGYRIDKRLEISDATAQQLSRGYAAMRKIIADGFKFASQDELCDARFFPRAGQKLDKEGTWGLSARKVYFPAIGFNRDKHDTRDASGRDTFVLFGLNEAAMLRDARTVKNAAATGELKYQMISKKENCASMALRVLRCGGAEHFVPYTAAWISEDPNHAHAYAQAVQAKIDTLNRQRAGVARHCERLCESTSVRLAWRAFSEASATTAGNAAGGPFAREADLGRASALAPRQARLDDLAREVERIVAYFAELSAGRSGKHRDRADADLADAMKRCAPSARDDVAALTRKARVFVETLDRHLGVPPPNDHSALQMQAAHAMIAQIEEFMAIAIAA